MKAGINTAQLLIRLPADLKERVEATANAEGVSVSAWAERVFEANVLPEEKTIDEEHKEARRLLSLLFKVNQEHRLVTYAEAAKMLGWDLRGSARMMGCVTDLLNAAAALTNVPLIALYTARANGFEGAFHNHPELRAQLLAEAQAYTFTQTDIANIEAQLDKLFLQGMGHMTAWRHVVETVPRFKDLYAEGTGAGTDYGVSGES